MDDVLNTLNDYVIIFDEEGFVRSVNSKFCEILKMSPVRDKLLDNRLTIDEILEVDKNNLLNNLKEKQIVHNFHSYLIQIFNLPKDQQLRGTLHWNDQLKKGLCIINFQDRDEKKMELESEIANQFSLMKGRMAEGIYNEFRNVLGLVSGYAEMAVDAREAGRPEGIQNDLKEIIKGCKRGRDILDKATLLAKKSENYPVLIEAERFLNEVAVSSKTFVPKNVIIEIESEKINSKFFVDPIKLSQLILSIILDLVEKLNESITYVHLKLNISKIIYKCNNNSRIVEGVSFRASYKKDKVFTNNKSKKNHDIFSQLSDRDTFMQKWAEVLGIRYSSVNTAEEFAANIVIPLSEPSLFEPIPKYSGPPHGNGENILLVDDESAVAEVTRRRLLKLGYQVEVHINPIEALNYALNASNAIDLLITDQIMPEMTGLQLVQEIKKVRENLKVIMMTGYASGITQEVCSKYGISGLAMKPLDEGELAVIVSNEIKN